MTEEKLEETSGEDEAKTDEAVTDETEAPATGDVQVSLPVCYGVKAGMTRVFDEIGNHVPVTVIKLIPNFISRVRKREKDGLEAYQIAYGEKREKLITKPVKGILRQAGIDSMLSRFSEFRVSEAALENLGKRVVCDFEKDSYVDVCGVSKGKGFQGVVKKFGHRGGPKSHGSKFHRTTGSIGNRATPGRVWKNKKMPGAMGGETKTVQNLRVVELNREDGYLLVRGPVPGSKDNFLRVEAAVKRT